MKLGVVGLPNVGKSTLFNALTNAKAESANYPFCTIEPNVGIALVPDERLQVLADMCNSKQIIPAVCEFYDIAGLVKGASEGEGLGNKFLSHIRETNAIVQVVRCFNDSDIIKTGVSPVDDAEVINLELILADLESVNKQVERVGKSIKQGDKSLIVEQSALSKIKTLLEEGRFASEAELTEDEQKASKNFFLITSKPMLYVANISEEDIRKKPEEIAGVKELMEYASKHNSSVIPVCARIEAEINGLEPEEQKMFIEDLGIGQRALDRLIRASYSLLGLMSYLTAGEKEVRAWTIPKGTKAPEAAGVIHTDFEKNFIKAEVVKYKDLVEVGGFIKAKEKGLVRIEGKDYIMKEGDVVLFRVGK